MEIALERPPHIAAPPVPRRALPSPAVDVAEIVAPAQPNRGNHALGLGIVAALHVLVGYALASGLAQKVVDTVRAPVDVRLIQEVKPPPPPPPEPPKRIVKVQQPRVAPPPPPAYVPPPQVEIAPPPAPVIAAVSTTPPPAPPPAPVVEVAPPAPVAKPAEPVAIGVVCPTMVKPTLPRRAEEEGIGGSVRAQATIRGGKVVSVDILASKPRGLFDAAVRTAMLQYGCESNAAELVAVQNFQFRSAE